MTKFFDALKVSEATIRQAKVGNKQWIVALTDGATNDDSISLETCLKILKGSPGQPDIIIIGVNLVPSYKPTMSKLAAATKTSLFIDASGGTQALDEAFEQVAEMICD